MSKVLKITKGKPVLMNKVDFVMYPARSMARFIQKIGDDIGDEYLFSLGYSAGMVVAKEFVEKFGWFGMGLAGKMKIIFKMFEVMGFGKLDIKIWDGKNDRLLYHKTNHPVVEKAAKLFGEKEKSCLFYAGIESAHWHNEMGIEGCKLKETQCISKGANFCEFSYNFFKK